MSQSSSKVDELYAEIQGQLPHLTVKKLTGKDGGETKKQFLEDINETLEDTNVLLYSPVTEAGVDITVKVKKVYGILSAKSNSQRAFLQMINRRRNVEEPRMDFLKGEGLEINSNYNFWKHSEVLELNRVTVGTGSELRSTEDATLLAIRAQEDAGLDINTDGEIRRATPSGFPLWSTDTPFNSLGTVGASTMLRRLNTAANSSG